MIAAVIGTVFTPTTIDRRYLPGRGILCSVAVHVALVFGLLWLSTSAVFTEGPRRIVRVRMIDLRDPNYRMYLPLPLLGGGDPETPSAAKTGEDAEVRPAAASSPKFSGPTYAGPQPIISDLPRPTNRVETILQPTIKELAIIQPPSFLPNIVRMTANAPAEPLLAPPPLPEIVKPAEPPATPLIVQPEMKVVEPPKPMPASADLPKVSLLPVVVEDAAPLLALSPTPAPHQESLSIPAGEARGRFAVSPEANLAGSESGSGNGAGDIAAETAAAGNLGSSSGGQDKKSGNGTSVANGSGGRATATPGSGTGAAASSGAGSSSGHGVGNGRDAFPGITILGGNVKGGTAGISASPNTGSNVISIGGTPPPLQTSYGITILSTEASGGGLPQFGVFSNEQIYTVYLDMRRTLADSAPSWTLEYAVQKGAADPASPVKTAAAGRPQQGLVLPFPVSKERPVFPEELVRKYLRRRLIVYAVINVAGKVEQTTVKESPDALLNDAVIKALSNWSFRPAQLDGEVVPVKVLMGIPLFLAQ